MILVTGGTGFIGRALVRTLLTRGHRVALLTRDPSQFGVEQADVVVRQGDLLDPTSLMAALDGVTTVVHLAAAMHDAGPSPPVIRRINVVGTANLARAAAQCKVEQFVHGSSAGVYGDGISVGFRDESSPVAPSTFYEQTKLDAERALVAELSATPVVWSILRPSGVHGPERLASARLYRRICRKPLWIHGPATVIVHPTYVGDIVTAILQMLGRTDLRGEVINIAGPRALTYPELLALLASRLGVRIYQYQLPPRITRRVGMMAGLKRLTRTVVNRSLDTTKARRLFGFEPYPIEVGIDETITWARREGLL